MGNYSYTVSLEHNVSGVSQNISRILSRLNHFLAFLLPIKPKTHLACRNAGPISFSYTSPPSLDPSTSTRP